jgi:hypothetical protein
MCNCYDMIRKLLESLLVVAVILASLVAQEKAGERPAAQNDSRPYGEYRIVPVRVHLLHSDECPAVNTTLQRTDIERIFRKANLIWHAAGLHLWVESVTEESPPSVAAVKMYDALPLDALLPLRPDGTHPDGMFHVYYVGALVVNGIFKQRDGIFVQEAAKLVTVPGGIDEPLPRVTSHELGHGLGLPHRQARTNLMASGTTGTLLNDEEIHDARRKAESFTWTYTPEQFLRSAGDMARRKKTDEAISRYRALTDLPGESPIKVQATAMQSGVRF